jgi:ribosomal-protein-alanine N-acetyltransferase
VRVSNDRAIQVYEKNGFITVNKRKKYYEDGEDAYLMVKPLGGLDI